MAECGRVYGNAVSISTQDTVFEEKSHPNDGACFANLGVLEDIP